MRWYLWLLIAGIPAAGHAADLAKPHYMSASDEKKWTEAVQNHRTEDGATVYQVLQFVAKLRPREFKFGNIGVGYNGATGAADSVGIDYWLGTKRLPNDALINLAYNVRETESGFAVTPFGWPFSQAMEKGSDAFLAAVDDEYEGQCIDQETHRKLC